MKKILLIILIAISFSMAAQPIATRNIGTDSITGLVKQVQTYKIIIDTDDSTVTNQYRVVLLSPNGKSVTSIYDGVYFDKNQQAATGFNGAVIAASNQFTQLRLSPLGQGIAGLIKADLDSAKVVNGMPKFKQQ